jgi:CD151 antigen
MPINRKYEKDDGCCSRNLLRNYLYIFNFFLLCGSFTVLGIGVWSYLTEHEFIRLVLDVKYPLTSYLLMGAGFIGLVASLFGCCGIARSDRCILLLYIGLLLVVFILEVVAGSLAYIYREEAFQDLQMSLNE